MQIKGGGHIMKKVTMRTIYNSYDLAGQYKKTVLKDLEQNGIKSVTANDIADLICLYDCQIWENEERQLKKFFKNNVWIIRGKIGKNTITSIFSDFEEVAEIINLDDCDAIHIYDKNGHLFIECSYHHRGVATYEIKRITYRGIDYLLNWQDNDNDKRTEEYIQNKIIDRFSTLPHFAHMVYG